MSNNKNMWVGIISTRGPKPMVSARVRNASSEELAEKMGIPVTEVDKILGTMQRDEVVYQNLRGLWGLVG